MAVPSGDKAFGKLFDKAWQRQFLSCLARSQQLSGEALSCLEPSYFEDARDRAIAAALLAHLRSYGELPSRATLVASLRNRARDGNIGNAKLSEVESVLDDLWEVELTEGLVASSYDSFVSFARQQALAGAIISGADLLASRPIHECADEVFELIDRVRMIGRDREEALDLRELPRLLSTQEQSLPTMATKTYASLDAAFGGGFGIGGLYTVMAPTGYGKTTTLVNWGSALMWRGYDVLHVTLELSSVKTGLLYGVRLVGITGRRELGSPDNVESLKKRLGDVVKMGGGALKIKEFPSGSLSFDRLRGYLMQMDIEGFKPSVLIVDYPDLMRLGGGREERYHKLEELYQRCRGLGQEFKFATLVATQSNRSAARKYKLNIDDVAASFGKVAVSDGVVAICMTDEERASKLGRIYVLKSREGERLRPIWARIDFGRCLIREMQEADVPSEFLEREKK